MLKQWYAVFEMFDKVKHFISRVSYTEDAKGLDSKARFSPSIYKGGQVGEERV